MQMTADTMSAFAVLGRFLHSLNEYCEEERGLHFDISDYDEYNFHKVRGLQHAAAWLHRCDSDLLTTFAILTAMQSMCLYRSGVAHETKQTTWCMSSSNLVILLLVFYLCQVRSLFNVTTSNLPQLQTLAADFSEPSSCACGMRY